MRGRILVTGGSGFIGSHTVVALMNREYAVRATVRSEDKITGVESIAAEHAVVGPLDFAVADLTKDDGWAEAMEGCDGVFHIASPFPLEMPEDPDEIIVPAVEGTRRVLKAAKEAGVPKVVLTSSLAAICYGEGGRADGVFTEDDWTQLDGDDLTPYIRSKTMAEQAAWKFVREQAPGLKLTVINPGLVLGHLLDMAHGTSVELIRRMLAGQMPATPRIGFSVVDVQDVADLHIRAFESDQAAGERFVCADKWMMLSEVATLMREVFPNEARRVPKSELPNFLVRWLSNVDPSLKQILIELDQRRVADHSRAERLLGWTPRPAEEAIKSTCASLIQMELV